MKLQITSMLQVLMQQLVQKQQRQQLVPLQLEQKQKHQELQLEQKLEQLLQQLVLVLERLLLFCCMQLKRLLTKIPIKEIFSFVNFQYVDQ